MKLSDRYKIYNDQPIGDQFHHYLNASDIDFSFIHEFETTPVLDRILHQANGKKILLVLTFKTIEKIIQEKSKFNDLKTLIEDKKIKLVIYQLDTVYDLSRECMGDKNWPVATDFLKTVESTVWCDGYVSKEIARRYPLTEFIQHFHYPWISVGTDPQAFSLSKTDTEKTNTFLNVMNSRRPHRQQLIRAMEDKPFLQDAVIKHNYGMMGGAHKCSDLNECGYGSIWLNGKDFKNHIPNLDWYAKTYFELLAESSFFDDDSFDFSEKITKPIIMEHPFIVLANKHFLKNLRSLGFKTFGEYIDESYDECIKFEDKIPIIIKNLERLDLSTSKKFYNDTKEIRQFNRRHLLYLQGKHISDKWAKFRDYLDNI
jgi:hypothetical protein